VLVRSPYGRKGAVGFLFGRMLAERGLQVVVQSVRGTFGSGGRFDPFDERADGLATLRWLRAQPWHSGGVGMTGPSYMGIVQWAVADEVDALAPSVTASQFRGMTYGSGTFSLASAMSWMLVLEVQERRLAPLLIAHGLRRSLPRLYTQTPIASADAVAAAGERVPVAQWLEDLAPDSPNWSARDYSSQVGDVAAPVQLIGGWHDIFLPWLIEDYRALLEAGRSPQLIVGPWTHMAPDLAAVSLREGLAWMRAHLLGDRRMLSDAPVRAFLTGAGRWLELDEWPPPGAAERRLHLHAGGRLAAGPPEGEAEPTRYRYDPAEPTPVLGGPLLMERRPVQDNRPLEARDDVRTFTGEPLAADLDAVGPVEAEVWMRSTREDTDLFVRVCDVDPDGASWNVTDALIRLRPGEPPRAEDGVARVRFELWPIAHRFRAGQRIRVQVSSGAHPRYARNPGTGEDALAATRLLAADQEVFHDATRPSAVVLRALPG
jgi:putative CocE/NonD family hydrolase